MTFHAYNYPSVATIRESIGGYSLTGPFGHVTHHPSIHSLRHQVKAMEGAGWKFNDARQAGLDI